MTVFYLNPVTGRFAWPRFVRYVVYLLQIPADRIALLISPAIAHRSHKRQSSDRSAMARIDAAERKIDAAERKIDALVDVMADMVEAADIKRLDVKIGTIFTIMENVTDTMGISRNGGPAGRHLSVVPNALPSAGNPEVGTANPTDYPPKPRRDPDAPFGRDESGQPIAKYGYRKDGRPRLTKPRVSKPMAKPKQSAGTLPSRNRNNVSVSRTNLGGTVNCDNITVTRTNPLVRACVVAYRAIRRLLAVRPRRRGRALSAPVPQPAALRRPA